MTTTLDGDLVRLEPLEARHEEALFNALDDPRVWRWLPLAHPDRAGFAEFFAFMLGEIAAGKQAAWATIDKSSGEAIGTSSYLAIRREHRGVEIGMTLVSPPAWGTGANVEAKLLMLDHAFNTLDCLRVEFKTDANNERSRGALEALPATFEGIFRRHMVAHYGIRDSAYYSVIAEDWPDVRANLTARLTAR